MRKFEIYQQILSEKKVDNFTSLVFETLLDSETTLEELSKMLGDYEVQSCFDIEKYEELAVGLATHHKIIPLIDQLVKLLETISYDLETKHFKIIINFVISDNGELRWLGRKLLNTFKMSTQDINITEYSEQQQIKWAVSLTQDFEDPECRIPLILDLFNSSYKEARMFLIFLLFEYTLNYFGLVKNKLESTEYSDSNEIENFKLFLDRCDQRFTLSHSCKELHSEFFAPDIYDILKSKTSEYIEDKVSEYEQQYKSPLLNLFPKIALGRGGGWKLPNRDVQQLANIKVSMHAPMMMASRTPLEIKHNLNVLLKNWESKV